MTKWKDGKFLKIVEAKFFDKTGVIKSTIFSDIVNSIAENKGCSLTYLRIGKYDNERHLKTTEKTTYTVNEDITEEEVKSDDANNNIHDNDFRVLVQICAIDMKSFNSKTKCPKCKHEFVSDEEIVMCSMWKSKTRVTSYEFKSTSDEFKSMS